MNDYISHLRAAGLTPATIKLRRYHIERLRQDAGKPLECITTADIERYISAQSWAPQTARSFITSCKKFFTWQEATGRGPNPAAVLGAPRTPRALPRPAHDAIIMQALRNADPRAQLMIELMAYGGLRRGEVATVRGEDVTPGRWLRVTGKGGHQRIVPIPGHLAARIEKANGWLFPGKIDGHLSARRVTEIVTALLPPGITPHALRHRYATAAYRGSRDILAVRDLLGHASVATTEVYTAVDASHLAAGAAAAWRLDAA